MARRRAWVPIALLVSAVAVGSLGSGTRPVQAAPAGPSVIAAVGDIACKNAPGNNRSVCQYDDVAATIAEGGYDRLLLLGDVQYEYGEYQNFVENYDVYFGGLLPITAPAPGNHDYGTDGAAGYFSYFGDRAPGAWYSFEQGDWHVVSLDSTSCRAGGAACEAGSPQYEWLAADLATNRSKCTLAYWHHPRFDHLKYQNANWVQDDLTRSRPLWNLLYDHGADVVLAGHNHNYSRWLPADKEGRLDNARGIVQFIVGTGGRSLNDFGNFHTRPATFARGQSQSFGFLELRLHSDTYDWRWVSAAGQPAFADQGSGACH